MYPKPTWKKIPLVWIKSKCWKRNCKKVDIILLYKHWQPLNGPTEGHCLIFSWQCRVDWSDHYSLVSERCCSIEYDWLWSVPLPSISPWWRPIIGWWSVLVTAWCVVVWCGGGVWYPGLPSVYSSPAPQSGPGLTNSDHWPPLAGSVQHQ